ncbi:MAG: restriction endonuclease [Acidobacteria bacterium]|nr:restriction endonuclease [Acidobacteriota bacterium]
MTTPKSSQGGSTGETYVVFHYPPELLQLLKDTIPLLCRSKKDMLLFFRGAGVPSTLLSGVEDKVISAPASISKFEIARTVLERLNAKKNDHLRELREVVRRVTEFEDFSTCWPGDVLKAKGLVAEVRRVVDVKDAFTRMRLEREEAARSSREEAQKRTEAAERRRKDMEAVRQDLFALFAESDAHKRGKALEGVLNRLFAAFGILVRESFTVKGLCGEGVIEQIDGVVEIDADLFLVEMKWWNKPLGTNEVAPHLVRVYGRGTQARGILISYTDFTEPAILTCKEALAGGALVALCKLQEIVTVLERYEQGADLKSVLRAKVHAAILDKQPWQEYRG